MICWFSVALPGRTPSSTSPAASAIPRATATAPSAPSRGGREKCGFQTPNTAGVCKGVNYYGDNMINAMVHDMVYYSMIMNYYDIDKPY